MRFSAFFHLPLLPAVSMAAMNHEERAEVDPRSGFCPANSIFYSKRKLLPLPSEPFLDVTTFISGKRHSGTTAFIDSHSGRRLSFSELWHSVDAVASALSVIHGVRKGQVVLILSPNSIFFPIVSLAVMSIGAVLTTTNPLNTPPEISSQVADSRPVLAFSTRLLLPKLAGLGFPIVLLDGSPATSDEGSRVVTTIDEMIANGPEVGRRREPVSQDDTATLLYSSGTTGTSKGVVSTHRNLIAMIEILNERFSGKGEKLTFICTVPMFHVYGLAGFAIGMLGIGATVVILSGRFDLREMVRAVAEHKVTHLPVVPPLLVSMLGSQKRLPLDSLLAVICGGAPLSREMTEMFRDKYPVIDIMQGYGLTETAAMGSSTETPEESLRYGTAGLLVSNTEARIVDPLTGKFQPVNCTGELWLRGPFVMTGYFNNSKATQSTLNPNGWLKTGDLCYIDGDGYLFVVDRLKELIKYKGYQVAPSELEALLLTHPEIIDAAVIPLPDKEAGQIPMACVVRKKGSELSEAAITEFIREQVAPYKRIRRVAFLPVIPKTPSGKILRRDLIRLAAASKL